MGKTATSETPASEAANAGAASTGPAGTGATGTSDLRRRKRIRTKQMVQREALALFASQGYTATTVDEIANAAAMSQRTFFRYFPTKEDVVLWDEYDEQPVTHLLADASIEHPIARMITAIRQMVSEAETKDRDLLLARIRLAVSMPELRARYMEQQLLLVHPLLEAIAERSGVDLDDLRLRVTIAALYATVMVSSERWLRLDGARPLVAILDQALFDLAAGAGDLATALAEVPGMLEAPAPADACRPAEAPGPT